MPDITQEVRGLLNAIGPNIERAYERSERDRRETAPWFRPFALLDPKEVVQTRVIAALLDPFGTHGQGDTFLRLFLKELNAHIPESNIDFAGILSHAHLQNVEILLEYMTRNIESDRRRIDLVVKLPQRYVIAIESKARGARDQRDQLQDYREELKKTFPRRFLLVYLSSEKPVDGEERSLWAKWEQERPQKAVRVKYGKFISSWLSVCQKQENCRSSKVRDFLQEFGKYVQSTDTEEGAMDETIQSAAKAAIESETTLRAAFAVIRAQDAIGLALGREFMIRLEQSLREKIPSDDWAIERCDRSNYQSVELKREHWGKLSVKFQMDFDEEKGIKYWTEEIGYGLYGEGKSSGNPRPAAVEAELTKMQKGPLSSGSKTDEWRCFQRWRPSNESMVDTALLLWNAPREIVNVLADDLIFLAHGLDKTLSRIVATARQSRAE